MPGMTPWMMSSRLGLVAEVIATESPSQERPIVIHSTCAVTASVAAWLGTNSVAVAMCVLSSRVLPLSTDPRQRIADQLIHHPPAAEGGLHHHHPGRLRRAPRRSPPPARSPAPLAARRAPRRVGSGRDEGDQPALVGDVHRVDARAARRRPPRSATPGRRPRAPIDRHARGAGQLVEHRGDAAAGGVAQAVQLGRRPRSSSASTAGHSEQVSDSISASRSNWSRASMIAVPCSPIGPETRTWSPGLDAVGGQPRRAGRPRRCRSCTGTCRRRRRARRPWCRRRRSRRRPRRGRRGDRLDLGAQHVGVEALLEDHRDGQRQRPGARPWPGR